MDIENGSSTEIGSFSNRDTISYQPQSIVDIEFLNHEHCQINESEIKDLSRKSVFENLVRNFNTKKTEDLTIFAE